MRRLTLALVILLAAWPQIAAPQSGETMSSRLVGEVFTSGQQLRYLSMLSDEIGSRLTGSAGARRAEDSMEAEMKRLGLANVHREPFAIPASWERGTANAVLVSHRDRALTVASYTWTPGTGGALEGEIIEVGAGRPEDVQRVRSRLQGRVALATPAGETLDAVIYNFYRTPLLVRELKDAGAIALLIASDKQHTMLYTAPVDFNARLAALPTLSIAREDVSLIRRLLGANKIPRVRLDVRNKLGPAFSPTTLSAKL